MSVGECDLTDYCTGASAECPEDSFEMNGKPCYNQAEGYCHDGQCPTHEQHCWRLFGPGKPHSSGRGGSAPAQVSSPATKTNPTWNSRLLSSILANKRSGINSWCCVTLELFFRQAPLLDQTCVLAWTNKGKKAPTVAKAYTASPAALHSEYFRLWKSCIRCWGYRRALIKIRTGWIRGWSTPCPGETSLALSGSLNLTEQYRVTKCPWSLFLILFIYIFSDRNLKCGSIFCGGGGESITGKRADYTILGVKCKAAVDDDKSRNINMVPNGARCGPNKVKLSTDTQYRTFLSLWMFNHTQRPVFRFVSRTDVWMYRSTGWRRTVQRNATTTGWVGRLFGPTRL